CCLRPRRSVDMEARHWFLRRHVIGYGVPCLLGVVTVAIVVAEKRFSLTWTNSLHIGMFNALLSMAAGVAGGIMSSDRPATRFWRAIGGAIAGYILNVAVVALLGNIILLAWGFATT